MTTQPRFDAIRLRKYVLIAEYLGDQRTARWFKDTDTGIWYVAQSWKRPDRRKPLNSRQRAYLESLGVGELARRAT